MRTRVLLAIPLTVAACSDIEKKNVPPEQPGTMTAAPPAADPPTIVTIRGRHLSVVIQSSPRGAVYTVVGDDGRTVIHQATLADLQAARPDLYHQIKGYQVESTRWWAGSLGDR